MYILKWKNTKGYQARKGEYLANTKTDSTPSLNSRNLAIFWTRKNIERGEGNVFDALNLSPRARNPSFKERFQIIEYLGRIH